MKKGPSGDTLSRDHQTTSIEEDPARHVARWTRSKPKKVDVCLLSVARGPRGEASQASTGELQAWALRELGGSERILDRGQVLDLMLGHGKPLAQFRELLLAGHGFSAKARDQLRVAVLAVSHSSSRPRGASQAASAR
jgi:hypothetical protein